MFSILGNTFADKGFYINLSSSVDRKEHIENLILKYQIEGLERFDALTDEMIQFSCTKSHLGIFKQSLDEDLEIIFVVEDDINIEDECYLPIKTEKTFFKDSIEKVKSDLENVEWDVLLFGCNPKSFIVPITENLGVVDKSTGAWAYLIKKRAYQFLLDNSNYKRDYIAIDDYLPLLNNYGFKTLTTLPLLINHASGFVSTLQPRGPVDYSTWIQGNYHRFLFDNYKENFMENKIEKEVTIVITGHFVENYMFYLKYLFHSLPNELKKCKILIHYDETSGFDVRLEQVRLNAYFRDYISEFNITLSTGFGGLINSLDSMVKKIRTPYFIFLEHDWVFLKKDNIDFLSLIDAFNNHNFINAVWFSKDDNVMRGFDIATDIDNNVTPFDLENRVSEVDLITVCRWSNNPAMFRLSKMKEWFELYIDNGGVGKIHQGQHNVEETMIPTYRKIISENKWDDIKDDWGTFLYGNLGEGPYVGHTDASRRYQGGSKSTPEINGEEYIKNNPL
jgi:GR25 family glycosyltransferase involved in LPS biosynthesis